MSSLASKLITALLKDNHDQKRRIEVSETSLKCSECGVSYDRAARTFVQYCLKHFGSIKHRDLCGWILKREPQTLEGFRVEHDRRIDLMLLQASCSVDSSEPANSEDIDCPQLEHFSEPDDTDSEISIGACSESSIGERCHEAESQTESFSSSRSCQTPSDSNSLSCN